MLCGHSPKRSAGVLPGTRQIWLNSSAGSAALRAALTPLPLAAKLPPRPGPAREPFPVYQTFSALLGVLTRAITQSGTRYALKRHLQLATSRTRSFGQFGEDLLVAALLDGIQLDYRRAYFIDIGAFHPSLISNTFLHYRRGMTGINLDPSPDKIRMFHAFRPRDLSLCRAVVPPDGPSEVTLASPPGYSEVASVIEGNAAPVALDAQFARRGLTYSKVPTITVTEIAKLAPAGKHLAYLNIDVEGLDEVLIAAMDFEAVRPHVLTVEAHLPYVGRLEALASSRTHQTLVAAGYLLMAQCGVTSVYFDGRMLPRLPALWV